MSVRSVAQGVHHNVCIVYLHSICAHLGTCCRVSRVNKASGVDLQGRKAPWGPAA